jgi:hypothetical protein
MPLIGLPQGKPIQDSNSVEAGVLRGWVEVQRRNRGRELLVLESDQLIWTLHRSAAYTPLQYP